MAATDDTPSPQGSAMPEIGADGKARFTGEEGGEERSTPGKDLGAAIVVGALAIFTIIASARLESPDTLFTHPGLFPFFTGVSLLVMAIYLGVKGVRAGGAENILAAPLRAAKEFFEDEESRRAVSLMVVVSVYVIAVGLVDFDLRLPTPIFVFQLSSYEIISVPYIAWVLRMFWKARVRNCLIVSFLMVEGLANVFRYAFHILMPAAG